MKPSGSPPTPAKKATAAGQLRVFRLPLGIVLRLVTGPLGPGSGFQVMLFTPMGWSLRIEVVG